MARIDYHQLYNLQDKVLSSIFNTEKEFYLTGGTCLSRFYHDKRYSDDLDFFTNSSSRFHFAVKNIRASLSNQFALTVTLESKDFIRFVVDDLLQVDFVNDRVERYKDVIVLENGFLIDHIENILSNKLTAVIGRDNAKDIFDIVLISRFHSFDWKEILKSAQGKASFNHEDLVIRLKSFPIGLLKRINLIDPLFLDSFSEDLERITQEIKNRQQHKNSLPRIK